MKIHLDELEMAREYARGQAFEDLSSEQTPWIRLFKEWCFLFVGLSWWFAS